MKTKLSFLRSPFSVLLIAVAMVFAGCKSDDEPSVREDVEYSYGNTPNSMKDFYPRSGSNAENHLKQKKGNVTLSAKRYHPEGSGGWHQFSYEVIDALVNEMLKPVYDFDPSSVFFAGDTIYFKQVEMEKAQASIDWMKARNIKVAAK
jgi:hypothetical protein